MMESMRNAAKTWVAKVLIGLLALSFAAWGIADMFTGSNRGALATVGDVKISGEEFNLAFNQYLQNYQRQTGQPLDAADARRLGVDRAVLNNLIQSAAIDNQAQKLGLGVSDLYLAQELAANPNFQDTAGKFDPDRFRQLLAANGLSEAGYFAEERQNRLREALTGTADGDLPVSKALVEAQYRYRNEQRDAKYFVITTAETEVPAPTEDEIKKEYEANPAAYTAPEYRSIAVMKAEPADIAAKVTVSEEDITAGFERYKGEYFTPEKRTILQLTFPTLEEATAAKEKLAAGADFMALAKERGFSEADVTFADKTKADFFDKAIADAAFSLSEGAVSEPIKGALATVLLKAVKITPEHQATLDEVRARLTDRLKLERAREEITSIYDAVEDARAAQTKFEEIADRASIPFQLIPAVDAQGRDKDGKDVDMPHKAELLKGAFESDVGLEADALQLDEGYVWYEVREVAPSAVRPLDAVKDQARNKVIADKARALSEDKAKKLVERLKAGAKLEEVAAEAGATVQTAQGLRRNESSSGFDVAAVAALFATPENGFAYAVNPDGKGARIMQSQAVLLPSFNPESEEAKALSQQLEGSVSNDVLFAYLGALQSGVGVSINEDLWRQISGTQTQ
jgi:peptidyl-prolyl cis-trans isomerase D